MIELIIGKNVHYFMNLSGADFLYFMNWILEGNFGTIRGWCLPKIWECLPHWEYVYYVIFTLSATNLRTSK